MACLYGAPRFRTFPDEDVLDCASEDKNDEAGAWAVSKGLTVASVVQLELVLY